MHICIFDLTISQICLRSSYTRAEYTHSICWACGFVNIHLSRTQTGAEIAAYKCQRDNVMCQLQISVDTPLNSAWIPVQQGLQIKKFNLPTLTTASQFFKSDAPIDMKRSLCDPSKLDIQWL